MQGPVSLHSENLAISVQKCAVLCCVMFNVVED
jgi:hypothetical protein